MRFYTLRAVLHSRGNRPVHMKQINYLPVYTVPARGYIVKHCEALRSIAKHCVTGGDRGEVGTFRAMIREEELNSRLGRTEKTGRVRVRVNC